MSSNIPAGAAAVAEAPVEETFTQKQERLIKAIKPGTLAGPSRPKDEYGTPNPDYILKLDPGNEQFFDPELYFSLRPQVEVYVRSDPENRHIPTVPLSIAGYYLDLEIESRHTVPVDFAEELIRCGLATGPGDQKRARRSRPGESRARQMQNARETGRQRMPDGFSMADFD